MTAKQIRQLKAAIASSAGPRRYVLQIRLECAVRRMARRHYETRLETALPSAWR